MWVGSQCDLLSPDASWGSFHCCGISDTVTDIRYGHPAGKLQGTAKLS
jgi:hypothetical protein